MKDLAIYIKKGETIPSKVFASITAYLQITEKDEFKLTLQPVKDIRSSCQNRFLWGAVYPAFIEACAGCGDGKEQHYIDVDWHKKYRKKYLRYLNSLTGEIYIRSTASLTVEEFSDYLDKLIKELTGDEYCGCLLDKHRDDYQIAMGVK